MYEVFLCFAKERPSLLKLYISKLIKKIRKGPSDLRSVQYLELIFSGFQELVVRAATPLAQKKAKTQSDLLMPTFNRTVRPVRGVYPDVDLHGSVIMSNSNTRTQPKSFPVTSGCIRYIWYNIICSRIKEKDQKCRYTQTTDYEFWV